MTDVANAPSARVRSLAAERIERLQREVGLHTDRPTDLPASLVVASANRVERLEQQLAHMAEQLDQVAGATASFERLLTARHLDYADQVRRLAATAEAALGDHRRQAESLLDEVRAATADRSARLDAMADALGVVSDDLHRVLNQVMTSLQEARASGAETDERSLALHDAVDHLRRQLGDAVSRLTAQPERTGDSAELADRASTVAGLRQAVAEELADLRADIGREIAALRREVQASDGGRRRTGLLREVQAALDQTRAELASDVGALVQELHDDRALVMQEVVAGQHELRRLRKQVAENLGPALEQGRRLDNELSRLMLELRALRSASPPGRSLLDAVTERRGAPAPARAPRPLRDRAGGPEGVSDEAVGRRGEAAERPLIRARRAQPR